MLNVKPAYKLPTHVSDHEEDEDDFDKEFELLQKKKQQQ
jgi:hypothetical protein